MLAHEITRTYLAGTRVRFDGFELGPTNSFDFAFGTLSTLEFVHLFSVFDGSRVHGQAERRPGRGDAPPGMYFTVINAKVIQAGEPRVSSDCVACGRQTVRVENEPLLHNVRSCRTVR
ncbi:hypothetical protein [Variovorax sp. E3]|uniref:hypothetical protein n=1 Tax=Variovorax sp. E3 TaxID=1914993 RepID=UPI0018DC051C|nr:hypothetical protein [Variovorax sp. E3]